MKRSFWGNLGVAWIVMITHVLVLFSSEGHELSVTIAQQASLVRVPGITERVVMVPEDIWKEDYMSQQNSDSCIVERPERLCYALHTLVRASRLDGSSLKNNAKIFKTYINALDGRGFAPMHYLVKRKDATISYVQTLLEYGADITQRSDVTVQSAKIQVFRIDAYRNAIDNMGGSPKEGIGRFFQSQCYGNNEVMQYTFQTILFQKLLAVVRKREVEQAQMEFLQEIRKSLGIPLWQEG